MLPEKAGDWLSGDNIINHLFNQQLFSFNSKIKKKKEKYLIVYFAAQNVKKVFITYYHFSEKLEYFNIPLH